MSNINPNNINGSFPVAGQDNDSQGFRDNFTNILNNFSFAKAELEDLAAKAVLKSALNGGTLNNSLAFNEVSNLKIRSYALSSYDYTNAPSSSIAIDFSLGNFFHFTSTQTHTLALTNWPNTGYAAVYVWMGIANVAHTITLPAAVSINNTDIAGINASTNTITFAATGNYLFRISSYDGGASYMVEDLTRAKSTISGNLNVSGNIIANGSAFIGGNVTITGNLFVNGNTTQVNVETLTVEDPMVDLGGGPAGATLTNNDGLDRGVLMRYYNAGAINAFMGWDTSESEFVIGSNVSVSSGLITVNTLGNIRAGNTTLANTTVTRLNTDNARITGGYADNIAIGATTANTGAFTTLAASGITTSTGNLVAAATTASTNTTTGALVVRGGAGIAGTVNVGTAIAVDSGAYGNVTTTQYASVFAAGAGPNTSSLMQVAAQNFAAGMGMWSSTGFEGKLYSSNGIEFVTSTTIRDKDTPTSGTAHVRISSTGTLYANSGTASTSTTSGALVVQGGAGVSGNVYTGGNLITAGGVINANFGEFLVINDQMFFANVVYNTFVIDTTSGLTISNLWISLPDSAVNGQTITFSVMSPITACYVDTPTPGKVKYLANTWATSGNAVVQLTYSTTSNKWLRTG